MTTPLSDRDAYRLSIRYDAPDYVKDADVADALGLDPSRNPMYADPAGGRYAVHTKAATWMSMAAAVDSGTVGDASWAAINAACEFFSLGPERSRILAKKASLVVASEDSSDDDPDSLYGWVEKLADGSVDRRIRMADAGEIKSAAEWLLVNRDVLEYGDRLHIAGRVLKRAADESVDLGSRGPEVDRIAGFGRSTAGDAVKAVAIRAAVLRMKHAEEAEALDVLAGELAKSPPNSREDRIKLAKMLDAVDRGLNLQSRYADGSLKRPEDQLFGTTESDAAGYLSKFASITANSLYLKTAIEATTVLDVVDQLGDELTSRLTDDGVFLDSAKIASSEVSDHERAVIAAALVAAGVNPLG